MERLTLACLNHLPSSILFVLDLTAQCGTSVQDQLTIRQAVEDSLPELLFFHYAFKVLVMLMACFTLFEL